MHLSSILRMKWFVDNYLKVVETDRKLTVLDVGSMDVNGSYRHLFPAEYYSYQGMDMEPGVNVDIVLKNPYDWSSIPSDSYDVVISGQAFEHIEFFWVTIAEMTRVVKKGGILCIIVPNGIWEHRYPVDCYRFYTDGMVALARFVSLEVLHAHTNCIPSKHALDWYIPDNPDSMLIAKKPYAGNAQTPDFGKYQCTPANHQQLRGNLIQLKSLHDDLVIAALVSLKRYKILYACVYSVLVGPVLIFLFMKKWFKR
jgi:SAM-dependent methyltransferase